MAVPGGEKEHMSYILLLVNILLLVTGQVLWKLGVGKLNFTFTFKGIVNAIFNPYILGGGFIYVIATAVWLYILSKNDLSKVYPLQSLCYVLGALAGILLFNEKITVSKFIGIGFIIIGAFIMGRS